MLDIGAWAEFIVIALLALIIIGPKDLPKALFMIGKWISKLRDLTYTAHNTLTMISHPYDETEPDRSKSSKQVKPTKSKQNKSSNET
jgi:sec-independent protein translocase protein TatB